MAPETTGLEETPDEKTFFESGGTAEPTLAPEPAPEPEPESAVEPEPAPEPEPEPTTESIKDPRMVPLAALHEERERRKEMAKELEQQRGKVQKLEQTWQQIQDRIAREQQEREREQQLARQRAEVEEAPNFEEDPAGFLRWQQEKIAERVGQIDEWRQTQAQVEQRANLQNQFTSQVAVLEQQFRTTKPDYDQAVQYLKVHRDQELSAWGLDPMMRNNIINQEVMFLAGNALQQGINPAELAYAQAQKYGWGKVPDPVSPPTSGETRPVAVLPSQVNEGARKMDDLAKGKQAARSLSQTRGPAPDNLTLDSLADITDPDEFDRQWDKMFGQGRII